MAELSQAGARLYWTLQAPLESGAAVFVMREDLNIDAPLQAYYHGVPQQQAPAPVTGAASSSSSGGGSSKWHPISQESITRLPVVSITVHEENLRDWADEWYTINQEGLDLADDEEADHHNVDADGPPTVAPLVVTASNGSFVTIHDYLSAVHPWLMGLRDQILCARNVADESYEPVGNERLLVVPDRPELVVAEDEDEWLASLRWRFERAGGQQQQLQ